MDKLFTAVLSLLSVAFVIGLYVIGVMINTIIWWIMFALFWAFGLSMYFLGKEVRKENSKE